MENKLTIVEDLVQTAEICIQDAYYLGYESGSKVNKLSFKTNNELIKSFIDHVQKNYQIFNNDNLGLSFVLGGVAYPAEVIIKNFLLSHDE